MCISKIVVFLQCKTIIIFKVKRHRLTNIPVKAFFYVSLRFTICKIEPFRPPQ